MTIAERVSEVQARVAAAAARSGRPAEAVTIVAAAKAQPVAAIDEVLAAGIAEIGCNYVQEAVSQRAAVVRPARWRLIGPLQRNKAGQAAGLFEAVDTIGDTRLAEALARRRSEAGLPPLEVLVQVRLGGEETKSGVDPAEVGRLLEAVQQIGHLACRGMMTMPPPAGPDESRRWFAELAELARRMRARTGLGLEVLSMGMSQDYEVAIVEGATHVRIGTGLFGPRPPR